MSFWNWFKSDSIEESIDHLYKNPCIPIRSIDGHESVYILRADSSKEWSKFNPILPIGELALDLTLMQGKIGDGYKVWSLLPFQFKIETGFDNIITRIKPL